MGGEWEGSGIVEEPGASRTPAEGCGGSGGRECDVGVLPLPRFLFPRVLLVQDLSCDPSSVPAIQSTQSCSWKFVGVWEQLGGYRLWRCAEALPVRPGGSGAAALVQRGPWNLPLLPSEISCSKNQVVGRRRGACWEPPLLPKGCKSCSSGCWPQAGAACIWGAQATLTHLPRAPGASPQLPTGSWGLVFPAWLWHAGPFPGTGTMGRGWILLPPAFCP